MKNIYRLLQAFLGVFILAWCFAGDSRAAPLTDVSQSTLPVVYINTDSGNPVTSKTTYVAGTMKIVLSENTEKFLNTYTGDFGKIEIRGRGNSTWGQPKKPYKIKLGEKADLFGMGEDKNWVLLANFLDRSNLRNVLAYDLSGELGMIYTKSIHVELVFNGEYVGVYQLCENIRISKNRVNIYDWEKNAEKIAEAIGTSSALTPEAVQKLEDSLKEDLSWITTGKFRNYIIADYFDVSSFDITGGYLIENDSYYDEVSKFTTDNKMKLMIKSPEYAITNDEMMKYLKTYIQDMEDAMYSKTRYNKDGKHYTEYMDMDSFVDFWIVNETFKNVELLYKSCYMYKDVGDVLRFGPVWDFDWASGNHVVLNTMSAAYDSWQHGESQDREYWYKALYSDPYFVVLLQDRWWEVRPIIDEMIAKIDVYYESLRDAAARDTAVWRTKRDMTFKQETDALKEWLINRVAWMDKQLALRDPNILKMGVVLSNSIYISVLGEDGEKLPLDLDSHFKSKADAYYYGNGILSLAIDLKSSPAASAAAVSATATVPATAARAEIFINGIRHSSHEIEAETGLSEVLIDSRELITADSGNRNVITVITYNTDGKIAGINYTTLSFDFFEEKIVADDTSDISGEKPGSDKLVKLKYAFGISLIILSVAFVSVSEIIAAKRKRHK